VTDVEVHLHFTMSASVPLRLLDMVFCTDRLLFVEYDYLTPLDLAMGTPAREADAFAARLRDEGLGAALDSAETSTELPYDDVDAIRVYDGGWLGRETVAVDTVSGSDWLVRVHGEIELDEFTEALRNVVSEHDVSVSRRAGMAFGGWPGRFSRR
jgi:hypothetical protein